MTSMYRASRVQQEQAVVPVVVADGGAGLVVGAQVGQLVVEAEGLARAGGADAAGEVELAADHVVPDAVHGVDVLLLARERGHVGHARVHVGGAHGVADRLALVHHLLRATGCTCGPRPSALVRAALVQQELREDQVAHVAGHPVELDQAHLGDLVAGPDRLLARARTCGRAGPPSAGPRPAACACRWPGSGPPPPRRGGPGCTARGCPPSPAPSARSPPSGAGAAGSMVRVV